MNYRKEPMIGVHIDKFAWMIGKWNGTSNLGYYEENWSENHNNEMIGYFRWFRNNKPYVYELIRLKDIDGHIKMHLRHFSVDFVSWEKDDEPIVLVLTELIGENATFVKEEKPDDGFLTYSKEDGKLIFRDNYPDKKLNFELTFEKSD
jgi:hypothetical protein